MFKNIFNLIKSFNFLKKEDEELRDENFDKENNNMKWYYLIAIIAILFSFFYYKDISRRIDLVYKIQDKQLNLNISEIINMTNRLLDEEYDKNDKEFLTFRLGSQTISPYYIHNNIKKSAFLFEDIEYNFMDYIFSSISYIQKCVSKKQISGLDKEVLMTINKDLNNIKNILSEEKDFDIYLISKARTNLKHKYKKINEIFKTIELNNAISKIYMNTDQEYEEKYVYKIIYNFLEKEFGYNIIGSFEYEKDDYINKDNLVVVDFDSDITFKKIRSKQEIPSVSKMLEFRVSMQDKLLDTDKLIENYLAKKGIKMMERDYETQRYQLPQEYDKDLVDKITIYDNEYEVYTDIEYLFNIDNIIIELKLDKTGILEVDIITS